MIPETVLSQILDRSDIVEIISERVPLKRAGRSFKAPCPFHHEKTPSFYVSPDKQIFHCFGCGAGGNVISFLMKEEGRDFREVVQSLADRYGIEIPEDDPKAAAWRERTDAFVKINALAAEEYQKCLNASPLAQTAREYLKARGLSAQTVADFRLGYAPESWDYLLRALKGRVNETALEKAGLAMPREGGGWYDRFRRRVIFPILDAKGRCVAFGGRVMDDSLPKYMNSPETELYVKGRHLYGLHQAQRAIQEADAAIVVEGYMDLLACHQAGVRHAVASLGTALTKDQARLIRRHTKNVVILYDADKAGEMATLRGLELLLEESMDVRIVRLEEGHDPDSYLRRHGPDKFQRRLGDTKSLFEYRLATLYEKHDGHSLPGRVKIADEMVRLLAKVPNEILRSAWTRELASALELPEEALTAEMKKSGSLRSSLAARPAAAVRAPEEAVKAGERLLIGLLLEDPALLEEARREITADDFRNAKTAEIAQAILSGGAAAGASGLVNRFSDDPESVRIISRASTEAETIADRRKAFDDCLQWFRRSRIDAQRDGLKGQIEDAQREGDPAKLKQLLARFNELNRGMRKTHEKK